MKNLIKRQFVYIIFCIFVNTTSVLYSLLIANMPIVFTDTNIDIKYAYMILFFLLLIVNNSNYIVAIYYNQINEVKIDRIINEIIINKSLDSLNTTKGLKKISMNRKQIQADGGVSNIINSICSFVIIFLSFVPVCMVLQNILGLMPLGIIVFLCCIKTIFIFRGELSIEQKVKNNINNEYLYNSYMSFMKQPRYGREVRLFNIGRKLYYSFIEYLHSSYFKRKEIHRSRMRINYVNYILDCVIVLICILSCSKDDYIGIIFAFTNSNYLNQSLTKMIHDIVNVKISIHHLRFTDEAKKEDKIIIHSIQSIVFNHVSYKYPNSNSYALHDIDLEFTGSKSYAIIGENGSGKSTLILLALGLLEPTEGSIYINGYNMSDIDKNTFYEIIGYIPQNPLLFPLTIKENIEIDGNKEYKSNTFRNRLDDDVFLPYNTVPRLSGGEQQLIEFYREYKKKYLILDEPTSKLSDENERMVFKEIMSHDGLRIIITHQLKYLKQVDEIILVENGTIMCHG